MAANQRPLTPIDPIPPEKAETVAESIPAEDSLQQEPLETEPAAPAEPRPIPIPTRTLPLLALLLAIGSIVVVFCAKTVHDRTPEELLLRLSRPHRTVTYWLEHGYFRSGGLEVRTPAANPVQFYRSGTGGVLISTFVTEKLYTTVTGRYSWRLQALHNQLVILLTAAILGLLAFRIASRFGVPPMHALILAGAIEILHYTFPATLAMFWELTGHEFFLLFAGIFLLLEERCLDNRTRLLTLAQAVSAFWLTYVEYIAGLAFIAAYAVIVVVLRKDRSTLMRIAWSVFLPAVLALAVFGAQRRWVSTQYPEIPQEGSAFLFRSGLDGSAQYYIDHWDIIYGRKHARANFPLNKDNHFTWKWMFLAGSAAMIVFLIAAIRGLAPPSALIAILSLLGTYLIYAAVFSQAVVIHPYLYDVLIYTPLVLALCAAVPSLVESMTGYRGITVVAVFLLAVWVSMVQLRDYMLWYPPPPPAAAHP